MDQIELERQYFARGVELLGNGNRSLVAQLFRLKNRNVAQARSDLERAATKHDPKAFIARIVQELSPTGTNGHSYAESWDYRAKHMQPKDTQPIVSPEERKRVGEKMAKLAAKLRGAPRDKDLPAELERRAELSAMRDEVLK